MGEVCQFRGLLKGHGGWVTSLAVSQDEESNHIVSGSRDKSVIMWKLTYGQGNYGLPLRRLRGHSDFIEDVVVSSDGQFALSASWDNTLRLWDLNASQTTKLFRGHTKDVLSVAFSVDNRQIVSGSRDKTIRLWNTLGECKYTIDGRDGHQDWVSCVRFSPNVQAPLIISGGWDKMVKVWRLKDCKLRANFIGHTGYVSTVCVSPDGAYAASAGKDGKVFVWDLNQGELVYVHDTGAVVNSLAFALNRYWLSAATDAGVKVWEFDTVKEVVTLNKSNYPAEFFGSERPSNPACLSVCWKVGTGNKAIMVTGWSDNHVRVFECA